MEYLIIGDTYQIKEDLKTWGCFWRPNEKAWATPWIEFKDTIEYKRLNGLAMAVGARMVPIELNDECQNIQDILNTNG